MTDAPAPTPSFWKWLIDLDTRKTTAALLAYSTVIALPIAHGDVSLHFVVPDAWIPYVQADIGLSGWFAGALAAVHNAVAIASPRQP